MSKKLKVSITSWEFPWLNFDEICRKARDYGLSYLDCNVPSREAVPDLLRALERYDMQVGAFGGTARSGSIKMNASTQGDIPELQRNFIEVIEIAAELNAPYVVSYFGGNWAYDPKASMQRYKRNMVPVLEAAEKHNVTVLIETEYNQVSTDVTRTADGTLDLIELVASPRFQVNFDPCNLFIASEEAYPYAYETLKPHIRHIHLKDATKYDPIRHGADYRKVVQTDARGNWICVALGQGGVNTEGLLKRLQADNYEGVVAIELHTLREKTEQVFDESIQYLKDHGVM